MRCPTSIATYNVKCLEFKPQNSVIDVLRAFHVDVCGLQEVPGEWNLKKIAEGTPYKTVFLGPYRTYGPGLVYRGDLLKVVSSKLHILKDGRGKKSALEVTLATHIHGHQFTVVVTHLDHRSEPQRLRELATLLNCVPKTPHILLGDFNALKRSDYTDKAWEAIATVRRQNQWEAPRTDVVEQLEAQGYLDVLPLRQPNIEPTSRFNTRVDYIFVSPELEHTVQSCYVADSPINRSDHKPIVMTIKHDHLDE